MSDFCERTDDLHWKKELTALRKAARFLRDPETSSSWRSPLSSNSGAAASCLNYLNGTKGHTIGVNQSGRHSELDYCFPLKRENNQKQVFLYNWRHHSSKSSDSGAKLEGDRTYGKQTSTPRSSGSSSSCAHKEGSKSDTYLDDPKVLFRSREPNKEKVVRKTFRTSKKSSGSTRHRISRTSAHLALLDLPSISSGGPLTSIEQSDDTEYCKSEDLQALTRDIRRKDGYTSKSASLLLSGRGKQSPSSKFLKHSHEDDSSFSCTPASTSSYNRYRKKNASVVASWDGTTGSFNGEDIERLDLPRRQGCGIPCYWSKRTPKHRGCGSCYSPSLSDTLRRKGSSILCGSQTMNQKRRSSRSIKQKLSSKSTQGLPLLTKSCEGRGSSVYSGESDDELSTNFGEMDLEASSRLDGRRWSMSYGSQEGLELIALTGADGPSGDIRSLSQKYTPRFFDEIIGQNIVVQSLINAISRDRIAPVYLFQGPRGTGKSTTARIFAAALNCEATKETKPCGTCSECIDFVSGKSIDLREVDATNKKGIDRVGYLLKSLSVAPLSYYSRYKVFIIDECHLLPTKTWSAFVKLLEEPPLHIVFIFITTDLDNLPRTVLSRCQKYLFNKIKDAEIVTRLKKLSAIENLDIETHALHLIALNADGSLRDAETMLEQLSLLGKRITTSLVNELVGVVSDEKLLDLLELAMSSDTAETVKRARDLMDSGVDPMALMSQLAGLIMDIIAGTYRLVGTKCNGSFFAGRNLTEVELDRLKQSLKLLLEAEKQLRLSSERSTWFTAALLQLGSVSSPDPSHSSNSRKQSYKTTEEDPTSTSWEVHSNKKPDAQHILRKSPCSSVSTPREVNQHLHPWGHPLALADSLRFDRTCACTQVGEGGTSGTPRRDIMTVSKVFSCSSPAKLDDIWERCIARCHSKTLRQLLHAHGRLVSFSEVEGVLVAYIEFQNRDIKSRAERFLSSITNSFEAVVRNNVEVRMGLMANREASRNRVNPVQSNSSAVQNKELAGIIAKESKSDFSNSIHDHSGVDPLKELPEGPRGGFNASEGRHCSQATSELPNFFEGNDGNYDRKDRNPLQRIQNIIDEQRLESAWLQLQATEKGTPESLSKLKPERNQVLPQDGFYSQNQIASMISAEVSSRNWEDDRELKALTIYDRKGQHADKSSQRIERYPRSPSLLHDRGYAGNFDKENLGYESGSGGHGCNGFLCWKSKHNTKGKVKPGTPIRLQRRKNFSWLGPCCGKAKKMESKYKR